MHTCVVSNDAPETVCTGAGGAKVCDNAGNCVGCVSNGDCTSGNCQQASNTCGLAADGHTCTVNNQCANNRCVGGLCCHTACNGTCMACAMALTGVADGTCSPITQGTAPLQANQCTAAPPCGNDGKCNGAGACEQAPATTACGTATCTGGMVTPQGTCSGTGTCNAGVTTSCGDYVCNAGGTACLMSCQMDGDPDCATGFYCKTATHTCVAQGGPGAPCTMSDQCLSPATCVLVDAGLMTCM